MKVVGYETDPAQVSPGGVGEDGNVWVIFPRNRVMFKFASHQLVPNHGTRPVEPREPCDWIRYHYADGDVSDMVLRGPDKEREAILAHLAKTLPDYSKGESE